MISISLRSENERKKTNPQTRVQGKVALAVLQGDLTIAEIMKKLDVQANQVTERKKQLLSSATEVFGRMTSNKGETEEVQVLHAKIGQLTMENGFLERGLERCSGLMEQDTFMRDNIVNH